MKPDHIAYLACPDCSGELVISWIDKVEGKSIESGHLRCSRCLSVYNILRHIPRFVREDNYAKSFGFEWNKHSRTQYDNHTGAGVSEGRFFKETKWPRDMRGQLILEVGSGSGRFTQQAASTGAMVVSLDYSAAVEANYGQNGDKDNVLIIQGDIYSMPLRKDLFDRVFCIGMLQHTPDVERAFLSLPLYLKPGGSLVIDVAKFQWWKYLLDTKRWLRPLARRLSFETLYKSCEKYINFMWPLTRVVHKLPKGRYINRLLLIPDYRGLYPLCEESLKEWAVLDMFDGLSPAYDKPQFINRVRRWFHAAGLVDIVVHYGYNGIEGRGTKPIGRLLVKPPLAASREGHCSTLHQYQ